MTTTSHLQEVSKVDQDWDRLKATTQALFLMSGTLFAASYGYAYLTAEAGMTLGAKLLNALGFTFAAAGGSYLAAQFTEQPITAFGNALRPYNSLYSDPESELYQSLYARYEKIKPQLAAHNITRLEYYFAVYRTWLYESQNPDWKMLVLRNISQFLKYILVVLEPVKKDRIPVTKALIDAKAKELLQLLETYPEQREAIIKFAKTMGFYQMQAKEYKNIRALCLEGPPGVGKTTLIQSICDIYGLNLIILKGKSTISEGAFERQFWDDLEPSKSNPVVQATYSSKSLGFEGYTVLFFDEIDKLPNSLESHPTPNMPTIQEVAQFLLALTDNDQITIKDPYTGFEIPKNHIIVVIAVNKSILKLIPGLESRMDVILFSKISTELKLEIAKIKLESLCASHNIAVTPELLDTVANMVEHNEEDGFRELGDDIKALVYSLSQSNFYSETILAEEPKEILNYYKSLIRLKSVETQDKDESKVNTPQATLAAAPAA